ncbi:3-hydroxyacyl-CoA dehydrogenase family protein [Chloroflexota bacterium]
MEIKRVGVVGFGTMGSGIVQACAQGGYQVIVVGRTDASVNKGLASIESILSRRVERGSLSQSEKDSIGARITSSTSTKDFADCDLVIEVVNEDLELKKKIFVELDNICPGHTILATNTSCLSVTDMAVATKRPEKVLGMHFHNPAPVMTLLELVKTIVTSDETIQTGREFGESLGKNVVVAPDVSGFIVTRLFTPFVLGAVRMLEDGIATRDEIDTACKGALNHPMGPLQVIDLIGLDTELSVDETLYEETKDPKYAPPTLLRKMVAAGWLGRKTGKGFYDYSSQK